MIGKIDEVKLESIYSTIIKSYLGMTLCEIRSKNKNVNVPSWHLWTAGRQISEVPGYPIYPVCFVPSGSSLSFAIQQTLRMSNQTTTTTWCYQIRRRVHRVTCGSRSTLRAGTPTYLVTRSMNLLSVDWNNFETVWVDVGIHQSASSLVHEGLDLTQDCLCVGLAKGSILRDFCPATPIL